MILSLVRRDRMSRRLPFLLCAACSVITAQTALAQAQPAPPADLPTSKIKMNEQTAGQQLRTRAPTGFEDVSNQTTTLFDLTFEGRHIGAFQATYRDNSLHFADPAAVAAALGDGVDTARVIALLSDTLPSNESLRCKPGEAVTSACGILPPGQSGLVVQPERFTVSLFLAQSFFKSRPVEIRRLGAPVSGPSLIQGARFSAALQGGDVRYGGIFDTVGSIGRTAIVGQTVLTDTQGLREQELYAQRIWSERRAAAGLLQDLNLLTFNSYRIAGAEFGSFFQTLIDGPNDTATPLEIVLPQRSLVEVYRDGILVQASQYDAGLQRINTQNFPTGSYTVRIVARNGNAVLLDEKRSFTKLANLPPPGKLAFDLRVGERVSDSYQLGSDIGTTPDRQAFLPPLTGEFAATASVQRRLGRSLAIGAKALMFGSRVYGEGSLQMFRGKLQGVVAGGIGSGGTWSGLVSGQVAFKSTTFSLSARTTHTDDPLGDATSFDLRTYRPFYRSEDSIFASVQRKLLGGTLALSAGYTRSSALPDRYTYSAQYTRPLRLPLIGVALMTAQGTISEIDRRFTLGFAFYRQVNRRTDAAFNMGGEVAHSNDGSVRNGVSPVASGTVTRNDQIGNTDLVTQLGGSTDADSNRVFALARASSQLGAADLTAQYETESGGGSDKSLLFNGQTGFAIGGGAFKLGVTNPASGLVLVKIKAKDDDASATSIPSHRVAGEQQDDDRPKTEIASGGYRVTVDSRPGAMVKPGQSVAVGLPALKSYRIGLKPEGAPPFDLEATVHDVPLYPGNVVRLDYTAREIVTLFGQAVDATGHPLRNARVQAGDDLITTDDLGYFTVTSPLEDTVTIKTGNGEPCLARPVQSIIGKTTSSVLYRVGKLSCDK